MSIRKDCDNGLFEFPEPYELKIRLKDMLEDEVDEKYFLSEKMLEKLEYARKNSKSGVVEIANLNKGGQKGGVYSTDGIVSSLTATDYKQPKQILAPYIVKQSYIQWDSSGKGYNSQQDRAYFQDGLCPTLSHCNNNGDKSQIVLCDKEEFLKTPIIGRTEDGVVVRNANKKGFDIAEAGDSIDIEHPNSNTRRGRVGHGISQTLTTADNKCVVVGLPEPLALDEQNEYIRKDGTVGTIMTDGSSPKHNNRVIQTDLRIRKLTPKECWRLQGFSDSDIDVCIANGLSNTQLYKQAGNSITVDVMEEIFCMLFDSEGDFYI